eukprot:TRINITY_DN9120_c0_g1_i7.p1 TRINITY_DN9120_c0_g1~~TRINITY_DN9120_c0_g1_i7.p1  ORF type:complete len:368 (+),score=95.16 TRINITY_DN9120_c0_g1_i7:243-1346(+)
MTTFSAGASCARRVPTGRCNCGTLSTSATRGGSSSGRASSAPPPRGFVLLGARLRAEVYGIDHRPLQDEALALGGSEQDAAELGRKRKYGPADELQELLEECRVFSSMRLSRYVSGPGTESSGGGSEGCEGRRPSGGRTGVAASLARLAGARLSDHVIDDYLDALGGCSAPLRDHALTCRGPLRLSVAEAPEAAAAALAELESLLLDETDPMRLCIRELRLTEVEVTPAVACFASALLSSGSVSSLACTGCTVPPEALGGSLPLQRYDGLSRLSFRSCGFGDAHLAALLEALAESTAVLQGLEALQLTGSFAPGLVARLLGVLLESAPRLCSLSLPRRHEDAVRRHALCDARPELLLNGSKARHRLS